jgi:hypothetical protein
MAGYSPGISRDVVKQYNPVNAMVIRNFNAVTGLLWIGLLQIE